MATMKSLIVVVGAKTEGFKKGIEKSAEALKSFEKRVEYTQKLAKGLIAGFAAVSAATVGLGIKSVQLAGKVEQTEVAFTTMLGSAEKAQEMLKGVQQFAATTPFQFEGISDAAKKLIAFGVSAEETIPTLRRIGDISAGIGAPIGEIAELYGKARVQGRLFAEDINQLTGRGIPIIQELAKQFGVAESEVRKLVESGQVNFQNLEQAFISLTSEGGKFAGLMQAQSQTILGLWSTLKDNITLSLTTIGQIITETFDLKPKMQNAIEWLGNLQAKLLDIRDTIEKYGVRAAIERFIPAHIQTVIVGVTGAVVGLATAITITLLPVLKATALAWWETLKPMIPYIVLGTAIALLAYTIYKNWSILKTFFPALWEVIKASFENMVIKIQYGWNKLKEVVYGVIRSILDTVAPLLDWLPGRLGESFEVMRQAVNSKLNDVGNNIDTLSSRTEQNRAKMEEALNTLSNSWGDLKQSIVGTFSPIKEQTDLLTKQSVVTDIASQTQNAFKDSLFKTADAQKDLKKETDKATKSIKEQAEALTGLAKVLGGKRAIDVSPKSIVSYYKAQYINKIYKETGEIPTLASGGIVKRPTLAMIGERGPEAVVPLQASGAGIDGMNITLNVYGSVGVKDIAEQLVREIRQKTGIRF